MKKIILFSIACVLIVSGIWTCYLKDYVTVLKYSKDSCNIVIAPDSIRIVPYFYVEDFNTLGAVIDFQSVGDSLLLKDLNVTVHSEDNPDQSIKIRYVSAVKHPIMTTGDVPLEEVKVNNFDDFSLNEKTIRNAGLPYNKITFYFKTWQISKTKFYNFSVKGTLLYKGNIFHFEKNIKTQRKVEYHPYQMMT